MRVVFRVDASLEIGNGHVMRCLTLAGALRKRGATCRFASRTHPGNLLDQVREHGFEAIGLEAPGGPPPPGEALPPLASWLGATWQADAEQTRAAMGEPVDWLVVDHYALDARWEKALRPHCRRILAIDDLADRDHDCDLLLDQNLGRRAEDYAGRVPEGCELRIGPRHVLLRPEFRELRRASLERRAPGRLERLLITMGGVDAEDATGQTLEALKRCPLPAECCITVVLGPHAPWAEKVRLQASAMPWATDVRVDVRAMARLMAESDLALGGAGTTAWERCCLGLPSLAMILAENQRVGALALEAAGAAVLVESRDGRPLDLEEKMARMRPETLQAMQRACAGIVDGAGAVRLAGRLCDARW